MFFRHEAQTAPAERAPSHETRERHESLAIPREAVEQSAPRASVQNGPEDYKPEFGSTVMASTRWTKGRGNKPLSSRLLNAGAGVLALPFVMGGRGIIFAAQDAARAVKGVAAFATNILKDQGPVVRVLALPLLVGGLIGGVVCGAAYGAVRGFFGAFPDVMRGIISSYTGGNVNYFSLAYRKYRD